MAQTVEIKADSPETAEEVVRLAREFIETLPRAYQRIDWVKRMAETHEAKGHTHCAQAMWKLHRELTTNA